MVYVFGKKVKYPVNDVTRTYLTDFTVSQLRWADRIVYDVLRGLDVTGKRDPTMEACLDKVQQVRPSGFPDITVCVSGALKEVLQSCDIKMLTLTPVDACFFMYFDIILRAMTS